MPLPNTNGVDETAVVDAGWFVASVEEIVEVGTDDDEAAAATLPPANSDEGFEPKTEVVAVLDAAELDPNKEVVVGLPKTKPLVELLTAVTTFEVAACVPNIGVVLLEAALDVELDAGDPNREGAPLV